MAFGMIVWAGSYMDLLPAFKILPPASHTLIRRNALMIAAHLVWGAVIAITVRQMRKQVKETT